MRMDEQVAKQVAKIENIISESEYRIITETKRIDRLKKKKEKLCEIRETMADYALDFVIK